MRTPRHITATPAWRSATTGRLSTLLLSAQVLPSRKMSRATARPSAPPKMYQPKLSPRGWKKALPASAGRMRGGLSQRLTFEATGPKPVTVTYRHERVQHPPRGILGGLPGTGGRDLVNGAKAPAKARIVLAPGDRITFETPGGGGMGPPSERDPAALARDIAEGYVTEAGAKAGVTFENLSSTEPLVVLRYFGPEVNPDAPEMGSANIACSSRIRVRRTNGGVAIRRHVHQLLQSGDRFGCAATVGCCAGPGVVSQERMLWAAADFQGSSVKRTGAGEEERTDPSQRRGEWKEDRLLRAKLPICRA